MGNFGRGNLGWMFEFWSRGREKGIFFGGVLMKVHCHGPGVSGSFLLKMGLVCGNIVIFPLTIALSPCASIMILVRNK